MYFDQTKIYSFQFLLQYVHKIENNNNILGYLEIRKFENYLFLQRIFTLLNQDFGHDYMRAKTEQETEALMSKIM